MAGGTFTIYGADTSGNNTIDTTGSGGPFNLTKTGDGAGSNTDPDVLDQGDTFVVSGFGTTEFVYDGTDGAGGVLAVEVPTGVGLAGQYVFSDTEQVAGNPLPAIVDEDTTICFAAGTLIAGPNGDCAVEALKIGDPILTQDGRTVPVKWVGRQTVYKLFTQRERFMPVRVAAGALEPGVPHTDLVLTADHALVLDGLAINAGALVNGTSIARVAHATLPDQVTYYHIETDAHDVILANGAAAESYVDYVSRQAFDNYAEYVELYGEEHTIPELDMPRVSAARLVPPAIKARLAVDDAA